MRVKAQAKAIRLSTPGKTQSADLSNRNQAQKAKHPAISVMAAKMYMGRALMMIGPLKAAKADAGQLGDMFFPGGDIMVVKRVEMMMSASARHHLHQVPGSVEKAV